MNFLGVFWHHRRIKYFWKLKNKIYSKHFFYSENNSQINKINPWFSTHREGKYSFDISPSPHNRFRNRHHQQYSNVSLAFYSVIFNQLTNTAITSLWPRWWFSRASSHKKGKHCRHLLLLIELIRFKTVSLWIFLKHKNCIIKSKAKCRSQWEHVKW